MACYVLLWCSIYHSSANAVISIRIYAIRNFPMKILHRVQLVLQIRFSWSCIFDHIDQQTAAWTESNFGVSYAYISTLIDNV